MTSNVIITFKTTALVAACAAAVLMAVAPAWSQAVDVGAAERLLEDNKCSKCHVVDRKKDGPALRDVAAKFRAEQDAVAKVTHHLTAGEKVKFPDGHEEKHKKAKGSPTEVDNLARWILTLPGGSKY